MRRQFNQFKDLIHNKSRNDRNEVLSQNVLNSEKHVENIKVALTNADKKISASLLSGTSSDSTGAAITPDKRIKKLPGSSLSACFNEASDKLLTSKKDSILGKIFDLCAELQKDSTSILAEHEHSVETNCLKKIESYLEKDLPSISRSRKQLNRTHSDLNNSKVKYESAKKALEGSSQISPFQIDGKLEPLKKEMEDFQTAFKQCRDSYETEILDFVSKEITIAQVFYDYIALQKEFHEKMLASLENIQSLHGAITNSRQKPVFGVKLEEHLRASGRQISIVIETCISLLLPHISEEGLFRISGSISKVKLIKNAFNAGQLDNLDLTSGDIHAVAGTLKSYLRELPEPLLTYDLYNSWIHTASITDQEERLKAIWNVCNSLPEDNRRNLAYLIKFLHELTKFSDQNKMSSQNLAIAIGPSLLWAKAESMEMSMSNLSPNLIDSLITYCDYFFPGDVTFVTNKQRPLDSLSDNSDPEFYNGAKNNANNTPRHKKPAPKPPAQILTDGVNSIRDKFGSFKKTKDKSQSERVDSPPVPVATVRRHNNLSPRVDGSRSRRPISICERPLVPPPGIPPRPNLSYKTSQDEFDDKSNEERNDSFFSNVSDDDGDSHENSNSTPTESCNLYPSLNDMNQSYSDNGESAFTFPCSEFIDDQQQGGIFTYADNEPTPDSDSGEADKCLSYPNLTPPQKPPRSASTGENNTTLSGTDQNHQLNQPTEYRQPPPLPVRPSKTPSPIPTSSGGSNSGNTVPTLSTFQSEKTYL